MGLNILIVDDDEILRRELSKWLEREGHNVKSVDSGKEAVEMVKSEDFKLVFTDLKMPGISGLDVIKVLKQLSPNVHMVMITAYGTIDTAVEAMKIGAEDYITKPFNMHQIQSIIENIKMTDKFEKQIKSLSLSVNVKSGDPFEHFLLMIRKHKGLCITTQNPKKIKEKYDLKNISLLWITSDKVCESCIHPKEIYDLKILIYSFYQENPNGVVLLDGFETLLENHSWETVGKFIREVLNNVLNEPSQLIISVKPDQVDENILTELKSIIGNQYTQLISDSLSSSIRRYILRFLSARDYSSFSEIQDKLNLEDSPKLSFHLKKLINDRIIKKDKNSGYSLTYRGENVVKFLDILDNEAVHEVQNNVSFMFDHKPF